MDRPPSPTCTTSFAMVHIFIAPLAVLSVTILATPCSALQGRAAGEIEAVPPGDIPVDQQPSWRWGAVDDRAIREPVGRDQYLEQQQVFPYAGSQQPENLMLLQQQQEELKQEQFQQQQQQQLQQEQQMFQPVVQPPQQLEQQQQLQSPQVSASSALPVAPTSAGEFSTYTFAPQYYNSGYGPAATNAGLQVDAMDQYSNLLQLPTPNKPAGILQGYNPQVMDPQRLVSDQSETRVAPGAAANSAFATYQGNQLSLLAQPGTTVAPPWSAALQSIIDAAENVNPLVTVASTLIWLGLVALVAFVYWDHKAHPPVPKFGEHQIPTDRWAYGLFDCCGEPRVCFFTCCCSGIRWADNMRMANYAAFWPALILYTMLQSMGNVTPYLGWLWFVWLFVVVYARNRLKQRFAIPTGCFSVVSDIFAYMCCTVCAITQEARQLELFWQADPQRAGIAEVGDRAFP